MSGGVLAVRPPEGGHVRPEENVIVGNTLLYGATAGRAFFRGLAASASGSATPASPPSSRASATTAAST